MPSALDAAVKTLQANPNTNINVEGHTCDLGTSEYNIGHANIHEEARRLNRRVALVVRLEP